MPGTFMDVVRSVKALESRPARNDSRSMEHGRMPKGVCLLRASGFAQGGAGMSALTEKYKPQAISEFIGLEKQQRGCWSKLAANRPMQPALQGTPGPGKNSLAYAFAREIRAEIHHVGSQECKVDVSCNDVVRMCHYVPRAGIVPRHHRWMSRCHVRCRSKGTCSRDHGRL